MTSLKISLKTLPQVIENIVVDNVFEISYSQKLDNVKEEYLTKFKICENCDACRKKNAICRSCVYNIPEIHRDWVARRERILNRINLFDGMEDNIIEEVDIDDFRQRIRNDRNRIFENQLKTYDIYINYLTKKLDNMSVEEFNRHIGENTLRDFLAPQFHIIFIMGAAPFGHMHNMTGLGRANGQFIPYYDEPSNICYFICIYIFCGGFNKFVKIPIKHFNGKKLYKFCII